MSIRLAHTSLERIKKVNPRPLSSDLAALYARGKLCPHHREEVVEFVAELSEDLGLQTASAGLAINIFDRYVARTWRTSPESKLIATVALTLAAKFLETSAPTFGDLAKLIGCTPQKLVDAELQVLGELGWDIHVATPHVVAEHLFIIVGASAACRKRTEFLIDVSHYEYQMLEVCITNAGHA